MSLLYRIGNLVEASEPIIVHGCNAQGVMGSGVAKAIRQRFPKAYKDYRSEYEENGLRLGQIVWSQIERNKWIANAITQKFYGRKPIKYVDYDAISKIFESIANEIKSTTIVQDNEYPVVAIPRIGSGLANGDWNIIEKIIDKKMPTGSVCVYDLK